MLFLQLLSKFELPFVASFLLLGSRVVFCSGTGVATEGIGVVTVLACTARRTSHVDFEKPGWNLQGHGTSRDKQRDQR